MKITFANDFTTRGGRIYKAGTTAEIQNDVARSLIHRGKAVEATFHDSPVGQRPTKRRKSASTSAAAETTNTPAGEKGKE